MSVIILPRTFNRIPAFVFSRKYSITFSLHALLLLLAYISDLFQTIEPCNFQFFWETERQTTEKPNVLKIENRKLRKKIAEFFYFIAKLSKLPKFWVEWRHNFQKYLESSEVWGPSLIWNTKMSVLVKIQVEIKPRNRLSDRNRKERKRSVSVSGQLVSKLYLCFTVLWTMPTLELIGTLLHLNQWVVIESPQN